MNTERLMHASFPPLPHKHTCLSPTLTNPAYAYNRTPAYFFRKAFVPKQNIVLEPLTTTSKPHPLFVFLRPSTKNKRASGAPPLGMRTDNYSWCFFFFNFFEVFLCFWSLWMTFFFSARGWLKKWNLEFLYYSNFPLSSLIKTQWFSCKRDSRHSWGQGPRGSLPLTTVPWSKNCVSRIAGGC